MSSARSRPEPFWLCHECSAQMRPIRVDGVPHCASCNGEFIEILDAEVNPDPRHDLPLPPPTRPGYSSPPVDPDFPDFSNPYRRSGPAPPGSGSSFLESLFSGVMAAAGSEGGSSGSGRRVGDGNSSHGAGGGGGSARTFNFTLGGGSGSVTFGSWGGQMGSFGPGSPNGPGGQGNQGLDSFFPGFAPPPVAPRTGAPGQRGPDPFEGQDFLRALMEAVYGDAVMGPQGRMSTGDYVVTQNGFDQVLEQLMHAVGPQGPLPATDAVIEGLPRLKLDDKTLESSQFKDCPVCKDDFSIGDEVMRVPCKHLFHPDCLQPWLKVNGSCPVCRFSLVPDEENRTAEQTAGPSGGDGSAGPGENAGQSIITGVLNRLFGQSGAANSASNPATPTAEVPPQAPLMPGALPQTGPAGPQPATSPQSNAATSGASAEHPSLSTDIPEDYRERHRQRERERERAREESYHEDLD